VGAKLVSDGVIQRMSDMLQVVVESHTLNVTGMGQREWRSKEGGKRAEDSNQERQLARPANLTSSSNPKETKPVGMS